MAICQWSKAKIFTISPFTKKVCWPLSLVQAAHLTVEKNYPTREKEVAQGYMRRHRTGEYQALSSGVPKRALLPKRLSHPSCISREGDIAVSLHLITIFKEPSIWQTQKEQCDRSVLWCLSKMNKQALFFHTCMKHKSSLTSGACF